MKILLLQGWPWLSEMPTPKPKQPWYQFSLRSLLLLTVFVAVLCFIGVCTNWLFSALAAMTVLIGGTAGRIVAGTRLGFVQGVLFGIQFALSCLFLPFPFLLNWESPWPWGVVLGIAVLIGGVLGGYSVRPRTGR
jgi:hypothetical protein